MQHAFNFLAVAAFALAYVFLTGASDLALEAKRDARTAVRDAGALRGEMNRLRADYPPHLNHNVVTFDERFHWRDI